MKKTIPILLSAALLLSACGQAAGTAETTSADAPAAVTETTAQTSAPKTTPGGVDKAETVYAKADADGTVTVPKALVPYMGCEVIGKQE